MLAAAWVGAASATIINVPLSHVGSVVVRASGYHAIYFDGPATTATTLQSAGCVLSDRAVIDQSDPGGPALLNAAHEAHASFFMVIVGVEGCAPVDNARDAPTAPKIVKIEVRGIWY